LNIKYKCPDNKLVSPEDCIKDCRMSHRCCPSAMPAHVNKHTRSWKGKLSVTQALNPTTQIYLSINNDRIINLQRNIYSMLGTINHSRHEAGGAHTDELECEIFLEDELNAGTTDQLQCVDGKYYLRDIKNKKVMQAKWILDYEKIGDKDYALPTWRQTGKKLKDRDDVVMQMNRYRMLLEKSRGITIEGMFMDVVFIDYSPTNSPSRFGLKYQYYGVPVRKLDDDFVLDFYKKADARIKHALKNGVDKFCYEDDDWKEFGAPGNRCNFYCESKDSCIEYFKKIGKDHKYA